MPRTRASERIRQGRRRLERAQQEEEEVAEEPAQQLPQKNAGEEEEAAAEELSKGHDETEEKETAEEEEEEEEEEEKFDSDGDAKHLLLTDYEKQREHRIKENSAKLAALNLPTLASSFRSFGRPQKGSSKRRGKEDDDYMPNDNGSNSDTDDSNNNEEEACPGIQQDANADDDDEDRALQQALALSLEASADDITGIRSRVSRTRKNKRHVSNKNDKMKKRKKGQQEQQFTNDDIAAIFSLIDEQGKGKFSATDLKRVARSHDFNWSKQEISDMIDIFDHNKDGQLDLLEFQGVFGRTDMLKTPLD